MLPAPSRQPRIGSSSIATPATRCGSRWLWFAVLYGRNCYRRITESGVALLAVHDLIDNLLATVAERTPQHPAPLTRHLLNLSV